MDLLPTEFKEKMQRQLGASYPLFTEALTKVPPTSIRLNPRKPTAREPGNPVPWTSYGYYLAERPVFTLDPLFHAGTYYVQEASSMFVEQALVKTMDLSKPLNVLDLCAAPGGKTTHILSLLNDKSFIVTNEVIRSRASVLSENVQKWGYPNCLVTNNDPQDFSALSGFFDVIVIDAPCSGEGLFRKDPLAVNQWSPENVQLCAARQKRILHDVWPALKQHGVLIYCTCTYNSEENENNLDGFSKEHDVDFIDLSPPSEWNIETIRKNNVIGYRFYPHHVSGEGFFISTFRKNGSGEMSDTRSRKNLATPSAKISTALSKWLQKPEGFSFHQHQDLVFALPTDRTHDVEKLLQHLRFVYGGVNIATVKHEKLIPEHALAVSTILNQDSFNIIEIEESVALQYLRRETPLLPPSDKGYSLLRFNNTALGWANVLQNRANNMYPQEWRIRMAASGSSS